MKSLYNYLMVFLVLMNVVLIYQNYNLPKDIRMAITGSTVDGGMGSDITTVYIADKLYKRNNLLYFDGTALGDGYKILSKFDYNPKYPDELMAGYMTPFGSDKNGAVYYLWSQFEIKNGEQVDGWFMPIDGNWQHKTDYLPMLVPIVERKKSDIMGIN